jgi:para-nitrobenzyl esterase
MIQWNTGEAGRNLAVRRWLPVLIFSGLVALSALLPHVASAEAAPEVRVRQGTLQGKEVGNGIVAFLGVPFAAPPIGPLRWQPPQPAGSWSGVRQAERYGMACSQNAPGFGTLFDKSQSEDCLYLNIWSPELKPKKRLPVMVYMHGGGFVGGAGSIPTFDGIALGRNGVITVTINYRLGIFGFFAHPELTHESPHKASGNYGLADQIAALRWVKENIAAFGGDSARVTIFGQSAGSISVLDLMASPLSRGLIAGVIAESGTPLLAGSDSSLAAAEKQGSAFVDAQGQTIAQLRTLPADELMKRWSTFAASSGGRTWPIVDGWILPRAPANVFAEHREMAIPLLTGSNAREGLRVPSEAELPGRLRDVFGDAAARAAALYPASATPDPILGSAANLFATDTSFRCPAVVIQNWHAQKGGPVYAYQFEEAVPGREAAGSQHSDEVSYVFGTLNMLVGASRVPEPIAKLSDTMVSYWANFAKSGNPNGPGVPEWPRFTTQRSAYLHLNAAGIRADIKLRGEVCDFYRETAVPRMLSENPPKLLP